MKRAMSISLGSSIRDKSAEIELLGETVHIERIGTNGDIEEAARLFKKFDGQVDAFGLGGIAFGFFVDKKWYPLHSVKPMVHYVKKTPIVDGSGLKMTLEANVLSFIESRIGDYITEKKVLITSCVDRWAIAKSFLDGGYQCVFGDLMFALGIPLAIRREKIAKMFSSILLPVVSHLPFKWIYPIGDMQERRRPKWKKYFSWASLIAGDCHYIKRYMPETLDGKVIVTNTTTREDVEIFRHSGIKFLITTTPVLAGRSFGTNLMEAAIIAASGKNRVFTQDEMKVLLGQLELEPVLRKLN